MKKWFIIAIVLVVFTGCADSVQLAEATCKGHGLAGFFEGLIDGWILVFAFIGSLFDPDIAVYDVCNSGGWYDFGFALGVGSSGGGATASVKRSRD